MKRTVAAILAALLGVTLCSCGKGKASSRAVKLTVWSISADKKVLDSMVDSFKEKNSGKSYDITVEYKSDDEIQNKLAEKSDDIADVFVFDDDRLDSLAKKGVLSPITSGKESVMSQNISNSVDAAMIGDTLYAYPMSVENGCVLYYDTRVISNSQASSLEDILDACKESDKRFCMDISNAWYLSSFFFAAGCKVSIDSDGQQICDFDSSAGVSAAESIKKLNKNEHFISGSDGTLINGIGDSIAAGICGVWAADDISAKLGNNYGASKLPSVKIGGTEMQMKSFVNYKLVGVSAQGNNKGEAMALAEWLTNEDNQQMRFKKSSLIPTNLTVLRTKEVKKDLAATALSVQTDYGISQREVLGSFWSPVSDFGEKIKSDSSKPVSDLLGKMVKSITK